MRAHESGQVEQARGDEPESRPSDAAKLQRSARSSSTRPPLLTPGTAGGSAPDRRSASAPAVAASRTTAIRCRPMASSTPPAAAMATGQGAPKVGRPKGTAALAKDGHGHHLETTEPRQGSGHALDTGLAEGDAPAGRPGAPITPTWPELVCTHR
jgi:hypothetical protein